MTWQEEDAVALERKVNGCARMQPDAVTKILRDHDLALGADPVSHTRPV
jgi:hypothetical protein